MGKCFEKFVISIGWSKDERVEEVKLQVQVHSSCSKDRIDPNFHRAEWAGEVSECSMLLLSLTL